MQTLPIWMGPLWPGLLGTVLEEHCGQSLGQSLFPLWISSLPLWISCPLRISLGQSLVQGRRVDAQMPVAFHGLDKPLLAFPDL